MEVGEKGGFYSDRNATRFNPRNPRMGMDRLFSEGPPCITPSALALTATISEV